MELKWEVLSSFIIYACDFDTKGGSQDGQKSLTQWNRSYARPFLATWRVSKWRDLLWHTAWRPSLWNSEQCWLRRKWSYFGERRSHIQWRRYGRDFQAKLPKSSLGGPERRLGIDFCFGKFWLDPVYVQELGNTNRVWMASFDWMYYGNNKRHQHLHKRHLFHTRLPGASSLDGTIERSATQVYQNVRGLGWPILGEYHRLLRRIAWLCVN